MMITVDRTKKLVASLLALPALAVVLMASPVPSRAEGDDAAVTYKAKCAMCHGAKAEKAFDPAKSDEVLVDAMLKGIKPKMPSYEQKISADQAKALVAYMKSLRQ